MFNAKEKLNKCNNFFLRKNQRKNRAASEVVGTLLLVSIGVSLFALLAVVTFTMPSIFFSESNTIDKYHWTSGRKYCCV